MHIAIYAIGGSRDGTFIGVATDGTTGVSLVEFMKTTGAYACSLHGTGLEQYDTSGDFLIDSAHALFQAAQIREYNKPVMFTPVGCE